MSSDQEIDLFSMGLMAAVVVGGAIFAPTRPPLGHSRRTGVQTPAGNLPEHGVAPLREALISWTVSSECQATSLMRMERLLPD